MIKKLSVLLILTIISLIMFSCNTNTVKILKRSLSYVEKHKLFGLTEDYKVIVTIGLKEVVPIIDGITGQVEDFVKVALIPLKLGGLEKKYKFRYGELEGELTPDTIKYQQGVTLSGNAVLDSIIIFSNGISEKVTLTDINDSNTSYLDALEASSKVLQKVIRENIKKNTLNREIYITIVEDTLGTNRFYYYIGYLSSPSLYSAALIDPYTKEAVAVKP